MLRLHQAALNGTAILVEDDGKFYQVEVVWPGDAPPAAGTAMVLEYRNLELAIKWGPWANELHPIVYDEELPPPPELVELVEKAFADYKAGRGYTP